ncbi:uncharacterized protein LOC127872400 [Dreissena polymorpha]|uniref:uncharacterized protein LOC127872400 n=1 Tax=Dreissena polymorpha TaxID=45954 RepID=UPI002265410D|nr:uncharacterized protein LOC127872400 [Dreissena polymorpha]
MDYLKCHDFLIADLRVDEQRHLVFATQFQLNLLQNATRWFMDGTFKVVKDPFKSRGQLLSIHAFIHKDGKLKQLPFVFALMSRKTEADYVAVLRAIRDRVPNLSVENVVLDFEKAAWKGIREVFPLVSIKGCVFHWVQSVWRKVQELGLATAYRNNQAIHQYVRQLMALPFLPAGHITETFHQLQARANSVQLRRYQ